MDVVVPSLCLPVLEASVRGWGRKRRGKTDVVDAVCESGVDLADDFLNCPLGGKVVGKVEGGGVDEGEGEDERRGVWVEGEVDIDGEGANVGSVAAASLDELCDGSELVLVGREGDVAGVEEEAEEGRLSGALAGDHEGVASGVAGEGIEGVVGCSGVHDVREGGRGADSVGDEGELAVVDDERHGEDDVRASPFGGDRATSCPRGEAGAGDDKRGSTTEPSVRYRTNRNTPSYPQIMYFMYIYATAEVYNIILCNIIFVDLELSPPKFPFIEFPMDRPYPDPHRRPFSSASSPVCPSAPCPALAVAGGPGTCTRASASRS